MKTFEFSIIASGLDPMAEDFDTRFYDAGCDDATVSFQKGHIIVDFARDAETMDAAIASAVDAVRAAGATVDRVEPDPLVNLTEIALRIGMSRAAISQYSSGQRGKEFPAPVARITSDSSLWDWTAIAFWFFKNKKVNQEVVQEALIVRESNEAIRAGEAPLRERIKQRVKNLEGTFAT